MKKKGLLHQLLNPPVVTTPPAGRIIRPLERRTDGNTAKRSEDLTGLVFGDMVVLGPDPDRKRCWICRRPSGTTTSIRADNLKKRCKS